MQISIVGGGIFAVTAARTLRGRGHDVRWITAGAVPDPLAESTDISKIVRVDYGADAALTDAMIVALERWRQLEGRAPRRLFHETGVLFLRRDAMAPGTFEGDSHALLTARGLPLERLDARAVATRFPVWNARAWGDGYYNPAGGWAESGAVLAWLAELAVGLGVERVDATVAAVEGTEVVLGDGTRLGADRVVVATGAWTPGLLPETAAFLRATAQPVFHLRPGDPTRFTGDRFPVFGADIGGTGWYGFPLHPTGVVKVANHGAGWPLDPRDPARAVPPEAEARLRAFLSGTFPSLAHAPVVASRACVYGDTADGQFWIDAHPDRPGVIVAAGGSGHAFKFTPLLGDWIADVTEGRAPPLGGRFAWREAKPGAEAARAAT